MNGGYHDLDDLCDTSDVTVLTLFGKQERLMELRRELNEKVIFWSNAFGFGNWGVYSNDDKGRGKR